MYVAMFVGIKILALLLKEATYTPTLMYLYMWTKHVIMYVHNLCHERAYAYSKVKCIRLTFEKPPM